VLCTSAVGAVGCNNICAPFSGRTSMFEASSVYMDSTQAKNLIDQSGDCNYDWNPQTEQA